MTIESGAQAPDFSLPSTSGAPSSLAQHRGQRNVLIAFFPLAFTGTCTAELCAFTEDYAEFESRDVAVIPISVDSVPTLREFKAKHAMAVEMASDFRRDVSRAYGVLNEEKFSSNRAYFLVDKLGIIRWVHVESVNGQRRENAEILAAIAALPA
ncbi:MAG: redoxin domain-containing protein [Gemmatimonadetes bacterium]|nr:redoxin domain-containing protein [Gemmatimonadota bacterium]